MGITKPKHKIIARNNWKTANGFTANWIRIHTRDKIVGYRKKKKKVCKGRKTGGGHYT